MKGKILSIIKELNFVTLDEIIIILGGLKKKTIEENIKKLEERQDILRILPRENCLSTEGFIPGPNFEAEDDIDIRESLSKKKLSRRDDAVYWEALSNRLKDILSSEIEELKEDIEKLYEEPKILEMRYFDLSLKYHELHRLLYHNLDVDILKPTHNLLEDCRIYLDRLDYRETP